MLHQQLGLGTRNQDVRRNPKRQAVKFLTMVFGVLLAGFIYSMPNAVWPATYAEYFPTGVRLSGMAIGTQFGFALAGFTPTIAGALLGGDAGNWYKVALFTAGACLLSAVAVLTGPSETHRVPTPALGAGTRPEPRVAAGSA